MSKSKYNWIKLKQEFFNSDFTDVAPFIRQRLDKDTSIDKNAANHTKGWAEDKKKWQIEENEKIQAEMRKELIEKLKVKVEDVLTGKKIAYELLLRYLECYLKQLQGKEEMTASELAFMKTFPISVDKIIKWFQIELGLPTSIAELQGSEEKPFYLIDLVREARAILDKRKNAGNEGKS